MQFQVETVEPAIDPTTGQQETFGDHNVPSFIVGGRWKGSIQNFYIREGEFAHVKGNFKKPPTPGSVEDFTPKTKRDDPNKSVNFKYQHPEHGEIWVKVIGRTPNGGAGAPQGATQGSSQQALPLKPTVTIPARLDQIFNEWLPEVCDRVGNCERIANWPADSKANLVTSVTMHVAIGTDQGKLSSPTPAEVVDEMPPMPVQDKDNIPF